jgi:hypothetical protein
LSREIDKKTKKYLTFVFEKMMIVIMENNIYQELKEYILYERRMKITHAADDIEISRQYLSDICNEKTKPGGQIAFKIQKWSNGRFQAAELMGLE